jgi:uncharacterized protein (TIGR03118 family)
MKHFSRTVAAAVIIVMCGIVNPAVRAEDDGDQRKGATRYIVTTLTSDLPGAPNTDVVLQNAWGVAFTPGASPFWIADNATGCSTLYDGSGMLQPQPTPLRVKLPLPGGTIPATACHHADPNNPPNPAPAAPTGLVWNPTTTSLVLNTTKPATFIFDTEDGTISAWTGGLTPPDQAVLAADNSPGAVYKGLAFGTNVHGVFLFATNFRAGTIDIFAPNGKNSSSDTLYFTAGPNDESNGLFGTITPESKE